MCRAALALIVLFATPFAWAARLHDGHGGAAAPSAFDDKAALAASQAAIGRALGDYTLVTGEGRRVRLNDYRGKPLVVSLVYTSCYHICPTTTQHLAQVVRKARAALGPESFRVLTIGFDSARDTPEAMRRFARQQGVDIAGWEFASADPATLEALTADLGFLYRASPHGFDHLIQATVVDAEGRVYRQVYGMQFATPLLVEPLKELVFGTPRTDSLLAGLANRIKLFCTVYDAANDRYRFGYSLFIGMVIGATSILLVGVFLVREWRRARI